MTHLFKDDIKALLTHYRASALKSRGQNFLIEKAYLERIAKLAESLGQRPILEIGAGVGNLSEYLCELDNRLVLVDIDPLFIQILRDRYGDTVNIDILEADMTDIEMVGQAMKLVGESSLVVGNLPYNAATRILTNLLLHSDLIPAMLIMTQLEVAYRINAKAQDPNRCYLSVAVQILFDSSVEFVLPPDAFWPRPKVQSAMILLKRKRRHDELSIDFESILKVIQASFQTRRKMIKNSLLQALGNHPLKSQVPTALTRAGIDGRLRAQELGTLDFIKLASEIHRAGIL